MPSMMHEGRHRSRLVSSIAIRLRAETTTHQARPATDLGLGWVDTMGRQQAEGEVRLHAPSRSSNVVAIPRNRALGCVERRQPLKAMTMACSILSTVRRVAPLRHDRSVSATFMAVPIILTWLASTRAVAHESDIAQEHAL